MEKRNKMGISTINCMLNKLQVDTVCEKEDLKPTGKNKTILYTLGLGKDFLG